MRRIKLRHSWLYLFPCLSFAQDVFVMPTELENFLANPNVVVENERLIGELESLDSSIAIFAIEAQDRSRPGTVARGARIDLRNNAWNDSVFLDEEQIEELARQLRIMDTVLRLLQEDESSPFSRARQASGQSTMGSELCSLRNNPQRILCPSFSQNRGFETFSLGVWGSQEMFPLDSDQLPALSRVIDAAVDRLQSGESFDDDSAVIESSDGDGVRSDPPLEVRPAESPNGSAADLSDSFEQLASRDLAELATKRFTNANLSMVIGALLLMVAVAVLLYVRRSRRAE